LTVTVTPAGGAPVANGSTTVVVPYSSMSAAYNNVGISDDSNEERWQLRRGRRQLLRGSAVGWNAQRADAAGGTVTIGKAPRSRGPDVSAGHPRQRRHGGSDRRSERHRNGTLGILGVQSQNGTASGTVTDPLHG